MNNQILIKIAQQVYDNLHKEFSRKVFSSYDFSYIICSENQKSKTREFKNFLIYLINYFYLTNIIDKTNFFFEKFARKLKFYYKIRIQKIK